MRAIVTMLRVPNLVIIALTFLVIRYFVFIPVYEIHSLVPGVTTLQFILMTTATILIAIAGYISNDYFDMLADRVNKPQKQIIRLYISERLAFSYAIFFSIVAAAIAIWFITETRIWITGLLLFTALFVVWWYAIKLKRSYLWGNLAVGCMSSGTIAMAWLSEIQSQNTDKTTEIISVIISAVILFAFLLTIIREIVKDIEDAEGDLLLNCRSLPIVKGIPATKKILNLLILLTFLLLIFSQITLISHSLPLTATWLAIFVEIPMIRFIINLKKAVKKTEFHELSTLVKWIMLGGISSLLTSLI